MVDHRVIKLLVDYILQIVHFLKELYIGSLAARVRPHRQILLSLLCLIHPIHKLTLIRAACDLRRAAHVLYVELSLVLFGAVFEAEGLVVLCEVVVFQGRAESDLMGLLFWFQCRSLGRRPLQVHPNTNLKRLEHIIHDHQIHLLLLILTIGPLDPMQPIKPTNKRIGILLNHGIVVRQCLPQRLKLAFRYRLHHVALILRIYEK